MAAIIVIVAFNVETIIIKACVYWSVFYFTRQVYFSVVFNQNAVLYFRKQQHGELLSIQFTYNTQSLAF